MDRLSDLPDSLVCHILSFLPTKFSAATSVLSKRWRYLWTQVPIVDLNSSYHKSNNPSGRRFSDVIDTVLMPHNQHELHTFRLTETQRGFTNHQLETWISIVAARGLRSLHIGLSFNNSIRLPRCLFPCKTLVQLTLHECNIGRSTVRLPALKKLHLVRVMLNCDESFSDLISGCPVLEELVIDNWWNNYIRYRVSSSTIKSIKMVQTDDSTPLRLDIDTPALKYLKIKDCLPNYISSRTRMSLVEADVRPAVYNYNVNDEGETFSYDSVLEFVDNLYNVETLCLILHAGDNLALLFLLGLSELVNATFPTSTVWFRNLTKLELAANGCFLLKFLEYAPNLRLLIIQKTDKYLKCWEEPQQVYPCLRSHLTSIIIHGFEGTTQDLEMVRYFLRNAKILKNMDINFQACDSFNYNEKGDARKSISLFERGSVACKLRFH